MNQDLEYRHKLYLAKDCLKKAIARLDSAQRAYDYYGDNDAEIEDCWSKIAEAGYDYWLIVKQQPCCQCECTKPKV